MQAVVLGRNSKHGFKSCAVELLFQFSSRAIVVVAVLLAEEALVVDVVVEVLFQVVEIRAMLGMIP